MFRSEIPSRFYQIGSLAFLLIFITFSTALGASNSGITEAPGNQDSFGHSRKLIRNLLDCINEGLIPNAYYDNKPANLKPSQKDCFIRSLLTELLDVVNQAYAAKDSRIASLLQENDDFKNETRENLKNPKSSLLQSSNVLSSINGNVADALGKLDSQATQNQQSLGLISVNITEALGRLVKLESYHLQSSTRLDSFNGSIVEALGRLDSLQSNNLQSSTILSTINQKVTEGQRRLRMLEYYSLLHFKTAYNLSGFHDIPVISQDGSLEGRPRNCEEIQAGGNSHSGIYTIFPFAVTADVGMEVFCDLVTDGGAWTVFQRRMPPLLIKVDFERTWTEYANGFGILIDNHWLGLNAISELTKFGDSALRIELTDWDDEVRVASYSSFKVANESELYKLSISGYSGDAGDSLSGHDTWLFTTIDRDNDIHTTENCAKYFHGAWWFSDCHASHLNGLYIENGRNVTYGHGICWNHWHGYHYSLKRTEMKIRSKHFRKL